MPAALPSLAPTLRLNNGVEMPALGLGVFQSAGADTVAAVRTAIETGYRLIDTAAGYANEREVGQGIRESGIPRAEIFVETKIWLTDYGYDETLHGFDKSARKLGVERIDLLLLHHTWAKQFERTLEAWRALETLLGDGRVRAIGVSNFQKPELDRLMARATVVPAVNQLEMHPYFQQRPTQAVNAGLGIVSQAWSPIGGVTVYRGGARNPLTDPVITAIAERHGRSAAQVMLRWHLQEGRAPIPKSVNPARIAENFAVFDFELAPDDLAAIDGLETGVRGGPEPDWITPETVPRVIPEA